MSDEPKVGDIITFSGRSIENPPVSHRVAMDPEAFQRLWDSPKPAIPDGWCVVEGVGVFKASLQSQHPELFTDEFGFAYRVERN